MLPGRLVDGLLVAVARRVRQWADRVLAEREVAPGAAEPAPQDRVGGEPPDGDGPPAHWLEMVRARAPHLLSLRAQSFEAPEQEWPWPRESFTPAPWPIAAPRTSSPPEVSPPPRSSSSPRPVREEAGADDLAPQARHADIAAQVQPAAPDGQPSAVAAAPDGRRCTRARAAG